MRDLIRKVLSEQKFTKIRSNPNIYGCILLKGSEQEFCKKFEKKINNRDIKTKLKSEFKSVLKSGIHDEKIRNSVIAYNKNNPFFLQSRKDLADFAIKITGTCDTAKLSIQNEIKKLTDKIVVLFKKTEKEEIYHLINRLDTNYSALAYLATIFRRNSKEKNPNLFGDSLESEVNKFYELYFIASPAKIEKGGNSVFFEQIFKYLGGDVNLNDYLSDAFEDVFHTISKTREIGISSEIEGFQYLRDKYPTDIKEYAGDFGFVDMMGVDGVMFSKKSNQWIPIQIKNKISSCLGNGKFCKNMCIGKNDYGQWVERYYYGYNEINL